MIKNTIIGRKLNGFYHTFRGMNRNIDFFDNEEIRMA